MPNVNKACAMLHTLESQKVVQKNFEEQIETSAMMVEVQNGNKSTSNKLKGLSRKESRNRKTS